MNWKDYILHKFSGIRKRILMLTFQSFIQKEIAERKGSCKRCGKCCRGCPALKYEGDKAVCSIYNERGALSCVWYPLKNNQYAMKEHNCGYYWKD